MERHPDAVVEGVAIVAWAVRAESAVIVVRSSAVRAAARLRDAIAAAEARGVIGPEAVETGRPLRIEVRELTGSFVVGEETGELEGMLVKVADTYDKEVNNAIQRTLKIFEPMLVLLIGGSVILIVASILLGMMEVTNIIM